MRFGRAPYSSRAGRTNLTNSRIRRTQRTDEPYRTREPTNPDEPHEPNEPSTNPTNHTNLLRRSVCVTPDANPDSPVLRRFSRFAISKFLIFFQFFGVALSAALPLKLCGFCWTLTGDLPQNSSSSQHFYRWLRRGLIGLDSSTRRGVKMRRAGTHRVSSWAYGHVVRLHKRPAKSTVSSPITPAVSCRA